MHVNAPHLTVDGAPLQASAFLVSNDQSLDFSVLQVLDLRAGKSLTALDALQVRFVALCGPSRRMRSNFINGIAERRISSFSVSWLRLSCQPSANLPNRVGPCF